uniref:G-protein alpha subunit n=1 Tax=Heterorhabditis bacteriophora TaxID=37862 RepID=A0A1I7XTG7_HETBA
MGATLCCTPLQPTMITENEIIRFFMVGTGAAGKTTVIRQLKCLCKERPKDYKAYDCEWNPIAPDDIFSKEEINGFRRIIQNNILTAVYNLIQQSKEWNEEYNVKSSVENVIKLIETIESEGRSVFDANIPPSIATDLIKILKDPAINETFQRHNEMIGKWRIEDGTLHFLTEAQITRIFNDNIQLNTTDVVHSRYPTTDIQDFRFSIKDKRIQIHDMGGQRTELMKLPRFINRWVVSDRESYQNFVLFVTSMAEFNSPDEDSKDHTAMERSMRILELILNMDPVQSCGVLIFLNKLDRFSEIVTLLQSNPEGRKEILKYLGDELREGKLPFKLKAYYVPAHKTKLHNGKCSVDALQSAVANKYKKVIKPKRRGEGAKGVYIRYTQAVDPKIMADIFDFIQNEIINHFIENAGYIP